MSCKCNYLIQLTDCLTDSIDSLFHGMSSYHFLWFQVIIVFYYHFYDFKLLFICINHVVVNFIIHVLICSRRRCIVVIHCFVELLFISSTVILFLFKGEFGNPVTVPELLKILAAASGTVTTSLPSPSLAAMTPFFCGIACDQGRCAGGSNRSYRVCGPFSDPLGVPQERRGRSLQPVLPAHREYAGPHLRLDGGGQGL